MKFSQTNGAPPEKEKEEDNEEKEEADAGGVGKDKAPQKSTEGRKSCEEDGEEEKEEGTGKYRPRASSY